MKDYLEDYYKLLETKADIDAFKDKFGDSTYDRFIKLRDRLKNMKDLDGNNISLDIIWHTKNTDPEDLLKLLDRAERREYTIGTESKLDVDGKLIPTPADTKQLLYNDNSVEVWFVTDYTDMIELSKGTGKGSIGGRNTGWCIGGRYEVHYGDVKVSQAKQYFNDYKKKYHLDGYIVVVTPKTKFCIIARNGQILNITDGDDNDHSDQKYINNFILKLPILLSIVAKVNHPDLIDNDETTWVLSYNKNIINSIDFYDSKNANLAKINNIGDLYRFNNEDVNHIEFKYGTTIGLSCQMKNEAINLLKFINSKYGRLDTNINNIKDINVTGPINIDKFKADPNYILSKDSDIKYYIVTNW